MYTSPQRYKPICAGYLLLYGMRPPTPPSSRETIYHRRLFDIVVRYMVAIWQMIYGVVVGCEILVMLQMSGPPLQKNDTLYESLCLTPLDKAHVLLETPCVFWIIMCLMFGGGILRLWCYSTMGRFFTFELTMSSDHYLVTTGPYSFIRHPSYTAAIMLIMGSLTEFFCVERIPFCLRSRHNLLRFTTLLLHRNGGL